MYKMKQHCECEPPPLAEQIRRRAYELYLGRGRQPGYLLDAWLQAEEEVLRARQKIVRSVEYVPASKTHLRLTGNEGLVAVETRCAALHRGTNIARRCYG